MKEKYERIEIRVKPENKKKIKSLADKCGLSISTYIMKRALGYEPKPVQPDAFYDFYAALCDISNLPLSEKTEEKLNSLIERIYEKFILSGKETVP